MHKVLDAEEIQVDERTQGVVTGAEVVHKGGKGRSQYSNKSNKAPASVVSEIIEKSAVKRGEKGMGVWNPLGRIYVCNGVPDVDLVDLSHDSMPRRGRRKNLQTKEYRQASASYMRLSNKLKATQKQVKNWNRPGTKQEEEIVMKDDARGDSTAPRKLTTIEIIQNLGQEKKVKKKPKVVKKPTYDFAHERDPNALVGKWHSQFAAIRKKKDGELLDNLVLREEDQAAVLRSRILRTNAVNIIVTSRAKSAPNRRIRRKPPRREMTRTFREKNSKNTNSWTSTRPIIQRGDTCKYMSPTGIVEFATVLDYEKLKGSNEFEYTLQPVGSTEVFPAYGRYLKKHYDKAETKRKPRKSSKDLSLWERAKLDKLKDMWIDVPAEHFASRIRRSDLERSKVNEEKAKGKSPKIPAYSVPIITTRHELLPHQSSTFKKTHQKHELRRGEVKYPEVTDDGDIEALTRTDRSESGLSVLRGSVRESILLATLGEKAVKFAQSAMDS
ncbi:hypothetical protein AAMO2058_001385200 [Amorphochlora amoebiformis]